MYEGPIGGGGTQPSAQLCPWRESRAGQLSSQLLWPLAKAKIEASGGKPYSS